MEGGIKGRKMNLIGECEATAGEGGNLCRGNPCRRGRGRRKALIEASVTCSRGTWVAMEVVSEC